MSKKYITIEFYSQHGAQHYTGRCVGLLTDKEFNAIINTKNLQKKLLTGKTVPLVDIANVSEVQNLRLAVVVKPTNSVGKKGLFITEPLDLISQFIAPDDLTLVGIEGSYIMINETEGP